MPHAVAHLRLPTSFPFRLHSLSCPSWASPWHCLPPTPELQDITATRQGGADKGSGGGSANVKEEGKSAKKPTRGEANTYPTSVLEGLSGLGASVRGHMLGGEARDSWGGGGC